MVADQNSHIAAGGDPDLASLEGEAVSEFLVREVLYLHQRFDKIKPA